jgi:hypothetical protein
VLLLFMSGQLVAAAHPRFGANAGKPVRDRGDDAAAILLDVLLGDIAHGDRFPLAIRNAEPEFALGFKHALRVMPKGTVPEVTQGLLGGINQSWMCW